MVSRTDCTRTQAAHRTIRHSVDMGFISLEWWLAIAVAIGLGVLGILHALAAGLRDCQRVLEMRGAVQRLRDDYARRAESAKERKGLRPLDQPGSSEKAA